MPVAAISATNNDAFVYWVGVLGRGCHLKEFFCFRLDNGLWGLSELLILAEKKKLVLAEKYKELKSKGQLESFMRKKRKQNAQKSDSSFPTRTKRWCSKSLNEYAISMVGIEEVNLLAESDTLYSLHEWVLV